MDESNKTECKIHMESSQKYGIYGLGLAEGKQKTVQKKVFKDKMAYNFSKEIKDIRPQTQEMLYTPRGINTINMFQGLSYLKQLKTKDKENKITTLKIGDNKPKNSFLNRYHGRQKIMIFYA